MNINKQTEVLLKVGASFYNTIVKFEQLTKNNKHKKSMSNERKIDSHNIKSLQTTAACLIADIAHIKNIISCLDTINDSLILEHYRAQLTKETNTLKYVQTLINKNNG